MGSHFIIRGQTDVAHNIIIDGNNNDIYTGDLNDRITEIKNAGNGYNTYYLGAGDDYAEIINQTTTVYGEDGDDHFIVNGKNAFIDGGSGNNTIEDNGTGTIKMNVPGANAQTTQIENLTAARSTIMDADIAKESADFTRAQILQQTSAALLAQSKNIRSSLIMSLLSA